MKISRTIILTFPFIPWSFCLRQQIEIDYVKTDSLGPMDNFYNEKMKTLYQCMELCLQFTACTGVTYYINTCYLHNADRDDMVRKCSCGGLFWERRHFPDHISGACKNHHCSIDTRCLPITGTSKHVCVPHSLPMFTCPWYWLRHDKSCYRPFFVNVTWQSAFDQCKMENASLVEIHDRDTQIYLKIVLHHFSGHDRPGEQLYWTALTDEETDGEWVWRASDKDLENYGQWTENATNWEKIVPGNDCVGLSKPDSYSWKPIKCDSVFFYVCEIVMVPR